MRAQVLTIEWHEERAPIYSVACNPWSNLLATGGQDSKVLIWELKGSTVEHVVTLEEHLATVNCVRWSPCGQFLASATDGGEAYGAQLLVWAFEPLTELWRVRHRMQIPRDVYDISWNPKSTEIVTAGTDSRVRIFDIKSGRIIDEWATHTHYIQGVAWDPRGEVVASEGMDRMLVVRTLANKHIQRVKELELDGLALGFMDEHASSYFRRLAFTPDGQFLVCPTASFERREKAKSETQASAQPSLGDEGTHPETKPMAKPEAKPMADASADRTRCTLVFSRNGLANSKPSMILPANAASIAVACSPRLYRSPRQLVDCDYACLFAVATQFTVSVYSTQQLEPLCVVEDLHPTAFTDLSWTRCGTKLILSSMEGFCSLIEIEADVLSEQEAKAAGAKAVGSTQAQQAAAATAAETEAPVQTTINTLVARKKK